MIKKERNISLDVIRTLAVLTVFTVHFQLNNGFYKHELMGEKMMIMALIRTFSGVCVPLFLLLTGYLMNKKTLSKKYYLSIIKVLVIFLFASVTYRLYAIIVLDKVFTLKDWVRDILTFSATRYTWYVEMYIGLFLIIPFLNLIWNGLAAKKEKILLVATFLAITMLPSVSDLVPDWWKGIYPITYYFLGSYLKEYGLPLRKRWIALCFLLVFALSSFYNIYKSYGQRFISGEWVDWNGWQCVLLSVLLFSFFEKCNLGGCPSIIKQIFITISNLSFGMYLASGIVDTYTYSKLNSIIERVPDRVMYFIVVIPFVFVCSLLLSAVWELAYISLSKAALAVKNKFIGAKNV